MNPVLKNKYSSRELVKDSSNQSILKGFIAGSDQISEISEFEAPTRNIKSKSSKKSEKQFIRTSVIRRDSDPYK